MRGCWELGAMLLVYGCATMAPRGSTPTRNVVKVELEATIDPRALFGEAREASGRGEVLRAIRLYDDLLRASPKHDVAMAARFNLGLLWERREAYRKALGYYAVIIEAPIAALKPDRQSWIAAHFRAGACHGKLGEWHQAAELFEALVALRILESRDELEARVGAGIARQELLEHDVAKLHFADALRLYRRKARVGRFEDDGLAAEAAFRLGMLAEERFASIELAGPDDRLRRDVEKKCARLLEAQDRYLQAIRYGDTHTAAASGYRIGWLYEELHRALVAVAIPPGLSASEANAYHHELHKRLSVLLKKAMRIYERSLVTGRRLRSAEGWVSKIEDALTRLRRIVFAEVEKRG